MMQHSRILIPLILVLWVSILGLGFAERSYPVGPDKADHISVKKKEKRHFITEEDLAEFRQWQEFKEFQHYKLRKAKRIEKLRQMRFFDLESDHSSSWDKIKSYKKKKHKKGDPPPIEEAALMARYIVNQAAWTSVATLSARKETEHFPFVNIVSFSDGPVGNGSGIPYLYLTSLDFTAQDLERDNRATLMMTLAQGHYCTVKNYDPMDPRCARVVLTGTIRAILEDNPEITLARNAVFGRHPWLAHMPEDHHFFFAKLKIATIAVIDTFGGPKYVTPKNYFHPTAAVFNNGEKKRDVIEIKNAPESLLPQNV